ncbi:hypothetical protein [Candidatus Thiosymbion oneisti]|uniref:hypothetical protein n=1 Tax=Candidatus Thiosymbion oneisti TaxID=589554 RepID=UPI00114CC319|nr:hypothetical protein [Candidatus Thiosymbion oneisti]
MKSDNPAGRLLNILENGKQHPSGMGCRGAWNKLLRINNSNPALLMSRLGKVMELPNQIIEKIQEHYPNQGSSHEHWSQKLDAAFAQQNLNGSWDSFIGHIDEHTINYLKMSMDLLDVKEGSKVIEDAELADIGNKVNDLLQETIDSEIDAEFKKHIVQYLSKTITGIDEYHISGAGPIVEGIECTLGHAFLDDKYRSSISETSLGKKIIDVLGQLHRS